MAAARIGTSIQLSIRSALHVEPLVEAAGRLIMKLGGNVAVGRGRERVGAVAEDGTGPL